MIYILGYAVCSLLMMALLSYMHVHYEGEHLRTKGLKAFCMYGLFWPAVVTVSILLAALVWCCWPSTSGPPKEQSTDVQQEEGS